LAILGGAGSSLKKGPKKSRQTRQEWVSLKRVGKREKHYIWTVEQPPVQEMNYITRFQSAKGIRIQDS